MGNQIKYFDDIFSVFSFPMEYAATKSQLNYANNASIGGE